MIDIPESDQGEQHTGSPAENSVKESPAKESVDESIPVTPEIKEILRKAGPQNGLSPVHNEKITVVATPVRPELSVVPAVPTGAPHLVTPPPHSEASSSASTPVRVLPAGRKNTFASISSLGSLQSGSTASLRSASSVRMKPPNVLVYSESPLTTENVKSVLNDTLHRHKLVSFALFLI